MTKDRLANFAPLEATKASKHTAEVWHYGFAKHCGWAIFTINNDTGELFITSDYGDWSHRWNTAALGCPDLKTFIAGGGFDYLARKLYPSHDEIDEDETRKDIKRRIVERRRGREIPADEAREAFDDIEDADIKAMAELWDWTSAINHAIEEPWEYVCRRPTHSFLVLRDRLLPFFVARLREEMGLPALTQKEAA